jgi:TIR domain-containing protein
MTSVVISYSHKDHRWLSRLLVHLRPLERDGLIDPWADTRIKPGEDWGKEIEASLANARVAVLLVSADFLASEFIASRELPALLQKAKRSQCKVLSVIVGPCLFSRIRDLQQFQAINSPERSLARMKKVQADECLVKAAETILDLAQDESGGARRALHDEVNARDGAISNLPRQFKGDPIVDNLIKGIKLADWDRAAETALKVIAMTNSEGRNRTFESLLSYQDCPDDDDRFWGAFHTVESSVRFAPWLIGHAQLSKMATHDNFSVRSSAASICMDLAHSAPDRVPLDILLKLSVYDEDWYVQAPANAALKAMARSFPDVLRIFYLRLHSGVQDERAHSAAQIEEVAEKEPGLVEPRLLGDELAHLKRLGDQKTFLRLRKVLSKVNRLELKGRYRYGP